MSDVDGWTTERRMRSPGQKCWLVLLSSSISHMSPHEVLINVFSTRRSTQALESTLKSENVRFEPLKKPTQVSIPSRISELIVYCTDMCCGI